jgi:hypothetical protein
VLATGKGGGQSLIRKTYMETLAAQIITGEVGAGYKNANMERGNIMEAEARSAYALMTDNDPTLVGFVRAWWLGDRFTAGASPDFLVGNDGLGEIKTKEGHLQVAVLLSGEVPTEHKIQVQGGLWICDREWCDFISYWPKLPMFIKRVYRDEAEIVRIREGVERFSDELLVMTEKLRRMF